MAQAQVLEAKSAQGLSSSRVIPPLDFDENNDYLRNILDLQNQVALLEGLVQREQMVVALAESYDKLNQPFVAPKLPYSTCAILPANISCALDYKELYPELNIASLMTPPPVRKPIYIEPVRVETVHVVSMIDAGGLSWTSIQCFAGKCHAIIRDENHNPARYTRVEAGDTLFQDNLEVVDIGAQGLNIKDKQGNIIPIVAFENDE